VYDLEYDVQLKAALEIVQGGKFAELMKNVKTLKVLQAEAGKTETAAAKTTTTAKTPQN
jgi:carboxyl-terminal processing protease